MWDVGPLTSGPPPAAGGGGAFSPSSLPSLLTWVKGDVGTFQDTGGTTPAITNAADVRRWNDQSGLANNLLSDPTTATAQLATASLNGLSTISKFIGLVQPLQASLAFSPTPATTFSFFGVFENTNGGTRNFDRFISALGNGAAADFNNLNAFQMATDNGAGSPIPLQAGQNSLTVPSSVAISTWHQMGMIYDGVHGTFYVDGVSQGQISVATSIITPLLFSVGAQSPGSSGMVGGVAELFAGNGDWTANVANIHSYLLGRWGV